MGQHLEKQHQQSDWTGKLSPAQLDYAAADAAVLLPLYRRLREAIDAAELGIALDLEERCLPAILWMGTAGVPCDADAWGALNQQSQSEADRLRDELDRRAAGLTVGGLFGTAVNWDSPQQVLEIFKAAGIKLNSTDDDALATVKHPLVELLRSYRAAGKLVSSYGIRFLSHIASNGRIYPTWKQLGADSGRMSCSNPNVQQVPRGKQYRRCFRAPSGKVLIKADYSQIELRIAAKVTGEAKMQEAYAAGEDLHTKTARLILNKLDVSKDDRQLAKALNFGLLYGMGAKGFRQHAKANYGVDLTDQQAGEYRSAFFAAYPGLRTWHRRTFDHPPGETRTLIGRRRLFSNPRFSDQLNTPIQGTGADGLKLALASLWERRGDCPGAVPVLAVHDEIVVECAAEQAEAATAWLKSSMVDALEPLLAPVPVVVEVKIGANWGGD